MSPASLFSPVADDDSSMEEEEEQGSQEALEAGHEQSQEQTQPQQAQQLATSAPGGGVASNGDAAMHAAAASAMPPPPPRPPRPELGAVPELAAQAPAFAASSREGAPLQPASLAAQDAFGFAALGAEGELGAFGADLDILEDPIAHRTRCAAAPRSALSTRRWPVRAPPTASVPET